MIMAGTKSMAISYQAKTKELFLNNISVSKLLAAPTEGIVQVKIDGTNQTLESGDSFTVTGKNAYAGQTLTATLTSIIASSVGEHEATFQLANNIGKVIDTQTEAAGEYVVFLDKNGNEVVETAIFVTGIKR